MGNSHSSESSKQSSPTSQSKIQRSLEIIIDGGRLLPLSHIYPSTPQPENYNREIIQTLILQRRLAPFFRGLDDWDSNFKEKDVDQALIEAEEESRKRVEKAVEDAKEELKQREISRAAAARAQANNVAAALAQHNQLLNVLGIQGVSTGSQSLPQSSSIDEASAPQLSTSLPSNLDPFRTLNPPRQSTDISSIVSNSAASQNLTHSQSNGSHQSSSTHPHFGLSSILGGGGSGSNSGGGGISGGNSNENHVFHGRRKEKELPLPPVLANPPHLFPFSELSEAERQSEIALYLPESIECPICFLYTPPLINRSRCCHQPICTECFVQIKRADPSVTNPNSEPACCPYCAVPNFGVTYEPPVTLLRIEEDDGADHKKKKKHSDSRPSDVVYTDQIHPNWEAKLAAVQATIARRANRRIVFRQVGDTLVPVGISSGRVSADSSSELPNEGRGSRRRNRGGEGIEASLTLEELMINEAIKRSLIEEEERQKKERENRKETPEPPSSLPPPLISSARLSPSHSRSASNTFREIVGSGLNAASIASPDLSSSIPSVSQSDASVSGEAISRAVVQSGLTLSAFGNSQQHSLSSTSLSPTRPSSFSNSLSVSDSDRPLLLPSLPSNHSTISIPTTVSSTFSEGDDPITSGYQRLEDDTPAEELQRTLQG